MEKTMVKRKVDIRKLVFTAVMAALSIVLSELLSFNVPFMPPFLSLDFSDVPAVMASMTMGPASGVCVCLIKNLEGMLTTKTACVGELANFILSASLVLPIGLVAKKTKKWAFVILGCVAGVLFSGGVSILSNYFITFPAYVAAGTPLEVIIGMYDKILPGTDTLIKALVRFNMPFTMFKGLIATVVALPLYRRLRPVFSSFEMEQLKKEK